MFCYSSQDLHVGIYSSIEHYSLICKHQELFLDELFSTSSPRQVSSSTSCLQFYSRRKAPAVESLSIIDYSARLVHYLLESSLTSSSLLINQILSVFLIYAPVTRFSVYLVHQTDVYRSVIVPLLTRSNTDYFVQAVIDETSRSQTDSTDRVFVFVHLINLLGELVLHGNVEMSSVVSSLSTLKQVFDALVECGTTVPLWYLLKCLGNLLTNDTAGVYREIHQLGLLTSLTNYIETLTNKTKPLHQNVLVSSLAILYNISMFDHQWLDREAIVHRICRSLLQSDGQQVRLLACLLYCQLLTPMELESDPSCLHLCEQVITAVRQAFHSDDYHLYQQVSLFTLVTGLKHLSMHDQFKRRLSNDEENIGLLFQIIRQCQSSADRQEEVQIILDTLWFLVFDSSCAAIIHRHDRYFALLVQLAEIHPNELIQRTARGILWQLRQTLAVVDTHPRANKPDSSQAHIMFSYNHDSKDLVYQICQTLRQAGYRIWLDIDDLHGSSLESMGRAVEQASLIILCMTEKYKTSPNCQSEAEYAHRLGKPLLPILLQTKYRPDGWLGLLLGTRLYIDFTKRDFQANSKKLLEEIQAMKQ